MSMKYHEEKKYVGHRDQLLRAKRMKLQDGKAGGVEFLDVQNHSGMHFDVNLSRGMDIPYLDFCGENIGFISPCGVVAPQYFDDKELGFLKSFTAGFMTTCGLKMAGAPCTYGGKHYGLHGNISHIPAEAVQYYIDETQEIPCIYIKGEMRDAVLFGEKLKLERTIQCLYKERKIYVHDRVTNEGFKRSRHMMLYHCNVGYPILSPASEIFIPSVEVKARTGHSEEGITDWMQVKKPDIDYEEMCYYHKLKADANNYSVVSIYNPEIEKGVAIEFDISTLDHFIQWKMMGAGDYVMGLEPANSTIDGIENAINNGEMKYLNPGESREYHLIFHILNSEQEFKIIKQRF